MYKSYIWLFKIQGTYYIEDKTKRWFYYLLALMTFLIFVIMPITIAFEGLNREVKTIHDVAVNILHAGLFINFAYGQLYHVIYQKEMKLMMNSVDRVYAQSLLNKNHINFVEDIDKSVKMFQKAYAGFTLFLGQLVVWAPFINYLFTGKIILPFPCWYPFDLNKAINYYFTIVLQAIAQFQLCGFVICTSGGLFISLYLVSEQYKILGFDLKMLFPRTLLEFGIDRNEVESFNLLFNKSEYVNDLNNIGTYEKVLDIVQQRKFVECLNKSFIRCIKHHQTLLKVAKTINSYYGTLYLMALIITSIFLTFVVFIMVTTTSLELRIYMLLYLCSGFLTVLIYCYGGQLLINASNELHSCLYTFPWYLIRDMKFKKSFLMMQKGVLKPSTFKIGNYFICGWFLLLAILKMVSSYFAVLRSVSE